MFATGTQWSTQPSPVNRCTTESPTSSTRSPTHSAVPCTAGAVRAGHPPPTDASARCARTGSADSGRSGRCVSGLFMTGCGTGTAATATICCSGGTSGYGTVFCTQPSGVAAESSVSSAAVPDAGAGVASAGGGAGAGAVCHDVDEGVELHRGTAHGGQETADEGVRLVARVDAEEAKLCEGGMQVLLREGAGPAHDGGVAVEHPDERPALHGVGFVAAVLAGRRQSRHPHSSRSGGGKGRRGEKERPTHSHSVHVPQVVLERRPHDGLRPRRSMKYRYCS
eukprot:Rhum_TRINITY_DN14688_c5_g1::Rhum_TRINITY_DN14688_c5_g1_i2::g.108917::m.108917